MTLSFCEGAGEGGGKKNHGEGEEGICRSSDPARGEENKSSPKVLACNLGIPPIISLRSLHAWAKFSENIADL